MRWKAWNERLAALPIINVKSLWLIPLDTATFVEMCRLAEKAMPVTGSTVTIVLANPIFDSWLFFMAALHGVQLGSYIAKRKTSRDDNIDEDHPAETDPKSDP